MNKIVILFNNMMAVISCNVCSTSKQLRTRYKQAKVNKICHCYFDLFLFFVLLPLGGVGTLILFQLSPTHTHINEPKLNIGRGYVEATVYTTYVQQFRVTSKRLSTQMVMMRYLEMMSACFCIMDLKQNPFQ